MRHTMQAILHEAAALKNSSMKSTRTSDHDDDDDDDNDASSSSPAVPVSWEGEGNNGSTAVVDDEDRACCIHRQDVAGRHDRSLEEMDETTCNNRHDDDDADRTIPSEARTTTTKTTTTTTAINDQDSSSHKVDENYQEDGEVRLVRLAQRTSQRYEEELSLTTSAESEFGTTRGRSVSDDGSDDFEDSFKVEEWDLIMDAIRKRSVVSSGMMQTTTTTVRKKMGLNDSEEVDTTMTIGSKFIKKHGGGIGKRKKMNPSLASTMGHLVDDVDTVSTNPPSQSTSHVRARRRETTVKHRTKGRTTNGDERTRRISGGGGGSCRHRETLSTSEIFDVDYSNFVQIQRVQEWMVEFRRADPRHKIFHFFHDVAQEGVVVDKEKSRTGGDSTSSFDSTRLSPILRAFRKSSVFSVWRPTSRESIRRMMLGEGVGKGLDIKGKSAKSGKLSAFVPFLQIHQEEHKKEVRSLRRDGKFRVYFNSKETRDTIVGNLIEVAKQMNRTVDEAKAILGAGSSMHDEATLEWAMEGLMWDMDDSSMNVIDLYAPHNFGVEIPERLFWEGMVVRQSIRREKGTADDTGRPSVPSFQDMNFSALRRSPREGDPRAVIMQLVPKGDEDGDPMSPLNLVMAYEEDDPARNRCRVIPVVSDFDCFMIGTRGVKYGDQLPDSQIEVLRWSVMQTANILKEKSSASWTERWLEVLKVEASNGFHPEIPQLGFSDPKTTFIFQHAIQRLAHEGAVRHGAECFNFYFPQDLDEEFLVISDDLPNNHSMQWMYVNQSELQGILSAMISKGYTFPLNPKWVLCDKGWKSLFDQLMSSQASNVQDSLQCWYPKESGLRSLIAEIYERHPEGFQRTTKTVDDNDDKSVRPTTVEEDDEDGTAAMDLAQEKLKNYLTFQRAKRRLKAILLVKRRIDQKREQRRREREARERRLQTSYVAGLLMIGTFLIAHRYLGSRRAIPGKC